MSGRERCDEVLRLIDDALADYEREAGAPASPPTVVRVRRDLAGRS